jgi:hypothetical protein
MVVLMEKDADVKLVDHAKKGIPPDTSVLSVPIQL